MAVCVSKVLDYFVSVCGSAGLMVVTHFISAKEFVVIFPLSHVWTVSLKRPSG